MSGEDQDEYGSLDLRIARGINSASWGDTESTFLYSVALLRIRSFRHLGATGSGFVFSNFFPPEQSERAAVLLQRRRRHAPRRAFLSRGTIRRSFLQLFVCGRGAASMRAHPVVEYTAKTGQK